MDEKEIILRFQQGDTHGLEELVLSYEGSLFRFCYYLCGNADGAEELFQDTWVRVLKNIHKYKVRGTFLGWLFTIAANLQRDKHRRYKRQQAITESSQHPPGALDDQVVNYEQRVLVRQALNTLDDIHRIPVTQYYFEDKSIENIAQLMGLPMGTVKTRLHRARKQLKKQLEALLDE